MSGANENTGIKYEFGNFVLDPHERVLLAAGEPTRLPDKVFDTLLLLVRHNGQLLTKDEMIASLWEEAFVEEANLAKNISRLRKILDLGGAELIETIPKRGYRFRADVRQIESDANLVIQRRLRVSVSSTSGSEDLSSLVDRSDVHSIAVLPFQPLDGKTDEFLGLGITDALITQLSRAGEIRVRPTSSIIRFNFQDRNAAVAGRQLQVDAILEGNYQRLDDRLRLTVQMLRSHDGSLVWADSFVARVSDIFDLQDQVAERVVGALRQKLSAQSRAKLAKRHTENVEAYQEYLKGRVFYNKRTTEGYDRALACYERAIVLDPGFALAHAGLADIYNLLPVYDGFAPRDYFPKAKAAALKALFLDGDLAEGHAALGLVILNYDWNWSGAETSYRTAIRLDPNCASAHLLLGVYLLRVDRISDAMIALKHAMDLDPSSPINAVWFGEALRYCGETDASIRLHLETLETFPDFFLCNYHLAFSYLDAGLTAEAELHGRRAVELSHENSLTLSLKGILQAASGNASAARETIEKLLELRNRKYVSSANIASVYAAMREESKAIEWLETGARERDPNLTWIGLDKEFEFLRSNKRFRDLVAEVGLAAMV